MKAYKIQRAEDFGIAFTCAIRMYMRDFDKETLNMVLKACDQYISYYSYNTVICAIRDLQEFHMYHYQVYEVPDAHKETYEHILKALVKQGLTLNKSYREYPFPSEEEQWISFAKEAELLNHYWGCSRFSTENEFISWVNKNDLFMPAEVKRGIGEAFTIGKNDLPLFYQLTETMLKYSLPRLSYMPSLCKNFIKDNMELFSDETLTHLYELAKGYVDDYSETNKYFISDYEYKEWKYFASYIQSEMESRTWFLKAKNNPEAIPKLLSQLVQNKRAKTYHEWLKTNDRFNGINRYVKSLPTSKREPYLSVIESTKEVIEKYAEKTWQKEEGFKYNKVGDYLYELKPEYKEDLFK